MEQDRTLVRERIQRMPFGRNLPIALVPTAADERLGSGRECCERIRDARHRLRTRARAVQVRLAARPRPRRVAAQGIRVQKATGGLVVEYEDKMIDFGKFERIPMKSAIIRERKELETYIPLQEEIRKTFDHASWIENSELVYCLSKSIQDRRDKKIFRESISLHNPVTDESALLHPEIDKDEIAKRFGEGWVQGIISRHVEGEDQRQSHLVKNWEYWRKSFKGTSFSAQDYGNAIVLIFDQVVEPTLVSPTFVVDYPKIISPLSKASPDNPNIAERFELFINGMEVANGFSELNDPKEQYERFVEQMSERDRGDEEAMILDEDYIRALSYGMPPAAGIGIGIDRLVMLLTNKHSIRDVILFPHMRPEKRDGEQGIEGEAEKN